MLRCEIMYANEIINFSQTKLAPPKYENSKNSQQSSSEYKKVKFWFATGGAGFCISRALAIKMMPLASNGKLVTICDKIRFPDDVTLGFIVEYLLKVPLTVVDTFHSHLERMDQLDSESFREQVRLHDHDFMGKFSIIQHC